MSSNGPSVAEFISQFNLFLEDNTSVECVTAKQIAPYVFSKINTNLNEEDVNKIIELLKKFAIDENEITSVPKKLVALDLVCAEINDVIGNKDLHFTRNKILREAPKFVMPSPQKTKKQEDLIDSYSASYEPEPLIDRLKNNAFDIPSEEEWEKAFQYAGDKIIRQYNRRKIKSTDEHIVFKIDYKKSKLDHSYIYADGKLLCVQRGEILGEGGFGKVKLAVDKDGNQYVIKIQQNTLEQDAELAISKKMGRHVGDFKRARKSKDPFFDFAKNNIPAGKATGYQIGQNIGGKRKFTITYQNQGGTFSKTLQVTEKEYQEIYINSKEKTYQIKPYLGSSLKDVLEVGGNRLNAADQIEVALKLADALAKVHDMDIIHRDLNSGNVLLRKRTDGFEAHIIDFGLSHYLENHTEIHCKNFAYHNNKILPPEIGKFDPITHDIIPDKNGNYTKGSDIYQLGLLLRDELKINVNALKPPLNEMLNIEPTDRPSIDMIREGLESILKEQKLTQDKPVSATPMIKSSILNDDLAIVHANDNATVRFSANTDYDAIGRSASSPTPNPKPVPQGSDYGAISSSPLTGFNSLAHNSEPDLQVSHDDSSTKHDEELEQSSSALSSSDSPNNATLFLDGAQLEKVQGSARSVAKKGQTLLNYRNAQIEKKLTSQALSAEQQNGVFNTSSILSGLIQDKQLKLLARTIDLTEDLQQNIDDKSCSSEKLEDYLRELESIKVENEQYVGKPGSNINVTQFFDDAIQSANDMLVVIEPTVEIEKPNTKSMLGRN